MRDARGFLIKKPRRFKVAREIENTALPIADNELKFPGIGFCKLTIGKFSFSNNYKHAAVFLQGILVFYKDLYFLVLNRQ